MVYLDIADQIYDAWDRAVERIFEWRCRRRCEHCAAGNKVEVRKTNLIEFVHTVYRIIPSALPGKTANAVLHTMCGAHDIRKERYTKCTTAQ